MAEAAHILVLEDDPSVQTLMKKQLTAHGFKVTVASDGLDGLMKLMHCWQQLPANRGNNYEIYSLMYGSCTCPNSCALPSNTALPSRRIIKLVRTSCEGIPSEGFICLVAGSK